jgi:hypothetical protein
MQYAFDSEYLVRLVLAGNGKHPAAAVGL